MEDLRLLDYVFTKYPGEKLMTSVQDKELRAVVNLLEIKTAVEIGTFHGVSAAYLAQFAKIKVITFDITDYPEKYDIWQKFNLMDKIEFHLIKSKAEIAKILEPVKFDFAFVDDGHSYEECRDDFNIVKRCGRVLIHDVIHPNFKGVAKFAEEIGAKFIGNNGYWVGK